MYTHVHRERLTDEGKKLKIVLCEKKIGFVKNYIWWYVHPFIVKYNENDCPYIENI